MGAALSSHGLDDPPHRQLLAEYLAHTQRNLDECAQIFRGAAGTRFGTDSDDDDDDNDNKHVRVTRSYPRRLDYTRFEEVFGMLVADAEPHFAFFLDEATQTACAHQVFCAIALLMRADLHAKVTFVLRLYADNATDELSAERRRLVLHDFVLALQLALNLAVDIPSDVVSALERALAADDESRTMSVHEVYDVCFTSALVSGFLHDVHELVLEFTAGYEHELQAAQSTLHALSATANSALEASAAATAGPTDKPKMLSRTASAFVLLHDSLLWTMRARDYPHFWRESRVELRADTASVHALQAMADADVHDVAVFDALPVSHAAADMRVYIGLLTTGAFLRFFLHFVPPDATRIHIERALRKVGAATLRDVLTCCSPRHTRFQCVDDDESFFSILLRVARGVERIAVLADAPAAAHCVLLGSLSASALLAWLEEDMALLNGKEAHALRAFPALFYVPASVAASATSVCNGFAALQARQLLAIAVTTSKDNASVPKVLSVEDFRDFFLQSYAVWAGVTASSADASPLLSMLSDVTSALADPPCVSPDDSLARAVHAMVRANATRVLIRSADTAADGSPPMTLGVVRATDILLLLLREQLALGNTATQRSLRL